MRLWLPFPGLGFVGIGEKCGTLRSVRAGRAQTALLNGEKKHAHHEAVWGSAVRSFARLPRISKFCFEVAEIP